MVFNYDDVTKVMRDPSFSSRESYARGSDPRMRRIADLVGEQSFEQPTLARSDAPVHTRVRRLLSRPFTPRAVADLGGLIQSVLDRLMARFASGDEIDLVTALGRPLPYRTMCTLLGMPEGSNDDLLIECSHAFTSARMEPFPTDAAILAAAEAGKTLYASMEEVVAYRRRHPDEGFISQMLTAADSGERLRPEEVLDLIIALFVAGHETTVNGISNSMLALLRNPEQWQLVVDAGEIVCDRC